MPCDFTKLHSGQHDLGEDRQQNNASRSNTLLSQEPHPPQKRRRRRARPGPRGRQGRRAQSLASAAGRWHSGHSSSWGGQRVPGAAALRGTESLLPSRTARPSRGGAFLPGCGCGCRTLNCARALRRLLSPRPAARAASDPHTLASAPRNPHRSQPGPLPQSG